MSLKHSVSTIDFDKISGLLFVVLLFVLPFVSYPFVLNATKVGQELYIVPVIALGLFFRAAFFYSTKAFKIKSIDVLFLLFFVYCVLHYYCYSYFGFLYNGFWIFSSYIILFYVFTSCFNTLKNKEKLFDFTIIFIWIIAVIQSFIGLLQEFDVLKSDNEFFKVVGTFINPNFLGITMLLGLITTLHLFVFIFSESKFWKFVLALSSITMIYVLFLTQSRAAWVGLCVAIVVFFGTAPKSVLFFKTNKIKTLGILLTILFLGLSSLYVLYKMDVDSVDGRTFIRKIAYSKIEEKPILGNGIFNFSGIYNQEKATYFLETNRSWQEIKIGDYVAFAFNDYIQLVFEIGFLGLFLMGLILFFILRNTVLNPKTRFALSIIISFCFLAIFTSVLYNPNAMIYAIWSLTILVAFGKIRIPIIEVKNQFFIKGFSVFLIGISCLTGFIFYKKTNGLSSFKTVSETPNQKIYYKLNDFDLLFVKEDPYVEFQLGYEKYQEEKLKLGLKMMENSVKKDPIPKANVVLSDLYFQQKKYTKTEQLLKMNIGIEPSRFEPRNNLLQFYIKTQQENKAVKMANEILQLPIKKAAPEVDAYKKTAQSILKKHNYN